jgi:hypothetical protein
MEFLVADENELGSCERSQQRERRLADALAFDFRFAVRQRCIGGESAFGVRLLPVHSV